MRCKTSRIGDEYRRLLSENPRLMKVLEALDNFCEVEFGNDICVTSILRTQEEHNALYAATPADKRPVSSPHMFWEAADIRSSDFTQPQIDKMVKFLNMFTFRNGKMVGMYHQVAGNAPHFHVQVGKVG